MAKYQVATDLLEVQITRIKNHILREKGELGQHQEVIQSLINSISEKEAELEHLQNALAQLSTFE